MPDHRTGHHLALQSWIRSSESEVPQMAKWNAVLVSAQKDLPAAIRYPSQLWWQRWYAWTLCVVVVQKRVVVGRGGVLGNDVIVHRVEGQSGQLQPGR